MRKAKRRNKQIRVGAACTNGLRKFLNASAMSDCYLKRKILIENIFRCNTAARAASLILLLPLLLSIMFYYYYSTLCLLIYLKKKKMQNSRETKVIVLFFFFFFKKLNVKEERTRILGAILVDFVPRCLIESSGFLNRE